jgi:hypothetical protein
MSKTRVGDYVITHTNDNIQYVTGIATMNQRLDCIVTMAKEIVKMRELLDQVHTAITAGTDEAELNRLYPLINAVLSN